MKISSSVKWFLVLLFVAVSIYGFMIKLPVPFRKMDKEMHAGYYFLAAAFLNLLFRNKNLFIHLLIFGLLYFFSMGIEHAQEYSNRFYRTRIHGRYDPEDMAWNLKGLLLFSAVWLVTVSRLYLFRNRSNQSSDINT